MGSQFVDFNADGHLDYLTATFAGNPYISFGQKEGFGKPEQLKDAQGNIILISSFWNYEAEEHQETGRSLPDGKKRAERCISALAFDWDADGDYDLLLGSYEKGHLYRQMNEGTNKAPKFTGKNIPILSGEKPFALPTKMTTPRLIDWDQDGDLDLVVGSFGDVWGSGGVGGGVYLLLNEGKIGQPRFAEMKTLIAPQKIDQVSLTRPDSGLYPEVVDYDGDGDLDLIVGGYSIWKPTAPKLTDELKKMVRNFEKERSQLIRSNNEIARKWREETAKATKGLKKGSDEYQEKVAAIREKFEPGLSKINKKERALSAKIEKYVPSQKREGFVWFYERE